METTPYFAKPSVATVVILEGDKITQFELNSKRQYEFGRECPGNLPDVPVYSPIVGRKHGRFLCIDREWFYLDLGSRNGTYYNGKKLDVGLNGKPRPVLLTSGDVLRVDSANLLAPDSRGVWMLFSTDVLGNKWENYPLFGREEIYIGREKSKNDIVLNLPYISARHTKITYLNGKYYVQDCNSREGTWLNGKKIDSACILREKDRISLCDCQFIFTGHSLLYNDHSQPEKNHKNENILIKADIAGKWVPDKSGTGQKELIRDVYVEIREGSLVALLGSSGAGKTTVMNCLNGMDINGVEGKVLLNGEDLYQNFNRLKFMIGSVPQKEVFHPMLTVEEELKEAAIMRLPSDTGKAEIKMHVDKTIQQLGLEDVRKSQIRKCSGGEQKRVNIAIELVAERKILCLDEPDAGLDPGTKRELFNILKNLAHNEGKTILTIIHDVSDIELFDQVIMMTKVQNVGRLAFSGTPEEGEKYFKTNIKDAYKLLADNPEKYVKGLEKWKKRK